MIYSRVTSPILLLAYVGIIALTLAQPIAGSRWDQGNTAGQVNTGTSMDYNMVEGIQSISNNSTIHIEAKPVVKNIGGNNVSMYSYNGQIPGPLIKVKQGSSIYVNLTNNIDIDTTVHWHGLRLNSSFDGVPGVTQKPIRPGESFIYKLDFPDEGIYWYHPHMRGDIGQAMGLYGNILVEPLNNTYNPVDKEVALFLSDIKITNGKIYPFSRNYTDFALTGRFGNIMLLNGLADYQLNVKKGEVVRIYLTDSANTRTFNFSIENTKMKLIGGDSGRYERESLVNSVTLGVGERYIVDVLFDKPGIFRILNILPERDNVTKISMLGRINVSGEESLSGKSANFSALKNNDDVIKEIEPFKKYLSAKPDYELNLTIKILDPQLASELGKMMGMGGAAEPIEWDEDDEMAMMNSMATNKNVEWIIRDNATGKEKPSYQVKVGDIKKIRIFNDPTSMHPMQHPIHLHGQHFLVLAQNGKANDNLVWKDTVLVPAGSTVDLLVPFTNPGDWMIHCHIPEHAEAGMIAFFNVSR